MPGFVGRSAEIRTRDPQSPSLVLSDIKVQQSVTPTGARGTTNHCKLRLCCATLAERRVT